MKQDTGPLAGKIEASVAAAELGFSLRAGQYSYAEAPKQFDAILGVTGTLDALSPYEKSIVHDVYQIKKRTLNFQCPILNIQ